MSKKNGNLGIGDGEVHVRHHERHRRHKQLSFVLIGKRKH
jgi:hypothetical protein